MGGGVILSGRSPTSLRSSGLGIGEAAARVTSHGAMHKAWDLHEEEALLRSRLRHDPLQNATVLISILSLCCSLNFELSVRTGPESDHKERRGGRRSNERGMPAMR